MRAFFNSLQANKDKYAGTSSAVTLGANNSNNNNNTNPNNQSSSSLLDLNHSSSSHSGILSSSSSTSRHSQLRLDSNNLVPFLDLLEQTVKQKQAHPNVVIEIKDNPKMMSIVNNFISGRDLNRVFLEQQNTNDLWSAVIKIIRMSDPILSAASCESLTKLSHETMHLDTNPIDNTNHRVTNHLPIHHQRLLGALFSASDMLIRLDEHSAPTVANSVSNALIWNSAPGSTTNHRAFCSLIHNQCENFPYYYTFADRVGLLVKPIDSQEWMAIFSNGTSGVIIGHSAALNPNYRHHDPGSSSNRSKMMQSLDLSAIPSSDSRVEVLEEKPWLPSSTQQQQQHTPRSGGRGMSRVVRSPEAMEDSLLSDNSLLMYDKRANTPNLSSASHESSPSSNSSEKRSTVGLTTRSPPEERVGAKYPFPTTLSPETPSPGPGNHNTQNQNQSSTYIKGIAMSLSNENLQNHNNNQRGIVVSSNNSNTTNNNRRGTEGKSHEREDSWDETNSLDEIPTTATTITAANRGISTTRSTGTPQIAATDPNNPSSSVSISSRQSSPSIYVKVKELQNVFSSSLVSVTSLEYRGVRNLDYSEDYADLKALKKNIEIFIGNRHLSTLLETGTFSTARQGYISWHDFLEVARTLLPDPERDYLRTHQIGYDDDLPSELSVALKPATTTTTTNNTAAGKTVTTKTTSIYDDFDDDEEDEDDASLMEIEMKESQSHTRPITARGRSTPSDTSRSEAKPRYDEKEEEVEEDNDLSLMQLDRSTRVTPHHHHHGREDTSAEDLLEESNSSFISIPELPTTTTTVAEEKQSRPSQPGLTRRGSSMWDQARPTATNSNNTTMDRKGSMTRFEDDDDDDNDSEEEKEGSHHHKEDARYDHPGEKKKQQKDTTTTLKATFSTNTIPHHPDYIHSDLDDDDEEEEADYHEEYRDRFPSTTTGIIPISSDLPRKISNTSNNSNSNYSTFSLTESTVSQLTGSVVSNNAYQNQRRETAAVTTTRTAMIAGNNSSHRNTPSSSHLEEKESKEETSNSNNNSNTTNNNNRPKWKKRVDLDEMSQSERSLFSKLEETPDPTPKAIISNTTTSRVRELLTEDSERKPQPQLTTTDSTDQMEDEFGFSPHPGDELISPLSDVTRDPPKPSTGSAAPVKPDKNQRPKASSTFSLTSIDPESDSPQPSPMKPPTQSSFVPLQESSLVGERRTSSSFQSQFAPPNRVLSTDSGITVASTANDESITSPEEQQLQGGPSVFESISLDSPVKTKPPASSNSNVETQSGDPPKKSKSTAKAAAKSIMGFFRNKAKTEKDANHNTTTTSTADPAAINHKFERVDSLSDPEPEEESRRSHSHRPSSSSESTTVTHLMSHQTNSLSNPHLPPPHNNTTTTSSNPPVSDNESTVTEKEKGKGNGSLFSKMKHAFKFTSNTSSSNPGSATSSRNASPNRPANTYPNTNNTTETTNTATASTAATLSEGIAATTPTPALRDPSPKGRGFPFFSSTSAAAREPAVRSSAKIELNPIDANPSSNTRSQSAPPLRGEEKRDTPTITATTATPTDNTASNKKPALSFMTAAAAAQKRQQQQQLQTQPSPVENLSQPSPHYLHVPESLSEPHDNPSLVMVTAEEKLVSGRSGGVGIAEKSIEDEKAAANKVPPLSIQTAGLTTTHTPLELPPSGRSTPVIRQRSTSAELELLGDSTIIGEGRGDLPPLRRINSASIPPMNSTKQPVTTTTAPAESTTTAKRSMSWLGKSTTKSTTRDSRTASRRFISGRGLAARLRKNPLTDQPPPTTTTTAITKNAIVSSLTASHPPREDNSNPTKKRLTELLLRSKQSSQVLQQAGEAWMKSFNNTSITTTTTSSSNRSVIPVVSTATTALPVLPQPQQPKKKKPMADRMIHDLKALSHYREEEAEAEEGQGESKGKAQTGKWLLGQPQTTTTTTATEEEEEEDPMPLLQSYWHQLKDHHEPRSLFLTATTISHYREMIASARPNVDIEKIKRKKAILFAKSQPIYRYEELNRYYDSVYRLHQTPLVQRMLEIIESQQAEEENEAEETEVVEEVGAATPTPSVMSHNTETVVTKTTATATTKKPQRSTTRYRHTVSRIPIHYIVDPLFGIHIFNTTLLISHLEEFQQQQQRQRAFDHDHLRFDRELAWNRSQPRPQQGLSHYRITHTKFQINPQVLYNIIHQNLFYTELQSILGFRLTGDLQKRLLSKNPAAQQRWKKRFFVLMIVPHDNPNLRSTIKTPTTTDNHKREKGEEQKQQDEQSERYQYLLVEYRRSITSAWGEIPIQFKRYYYLKDLLYIMVDSEMGKEGREFTLCFRINESQTISGIRPVDVERRKLTHIIDNPTNNPTATTDNASNPDPTKDPTAAVVPILPPLGGSTTPSESLLPPPPPPGATEGLTGTTSGETGKPPLVRRMSSRSKLPRRPSKQLGDLKDNPDQASEIDEENEDAEEEEDEDDDADLLELLQQQQSDLQNNPQQYHYRPGTNLPSNRETATATPTLDNGYGSNKQWTSEAFQAFTNKKMKDNTFIKVTLQAATANERVQWVQMLQSVAAEDVYINTLNYQ